MTNLIIVNCESLWTQMTLESIWSEYDLSIDLNLMSGSWFRRAGMSDLDLEYESIRIYLLCLPDRIVVISDYKRLLPSCWIIFQRNICTNRQNRRSTSFIRYNYQVRLSRGNCDHSLHHTISETFPFVSFCIFIITKLTAHRIPTSILQLSNSLLIFFPDLSFIRYRRIFSFCVL